MDDAKDGGELRPLEAEKPSILFYWLSGLTVAWIVAAILMIAWSAPPPGVAPWDFGGRLRNLDPNEVGDLFAGVFAPLAFIWVVATVLIQSRELKAQRQELRDNRMVAAAQRDAMKQQAAESREQTRLLKLEAEAREQKESDEICSAILSALVTHIRSRGLNVLKGTWPDGVKRTVMRIDQEDMNKDVHELLFAFGVEVDRAQIRLERDGITPIPNVTSNYFLHDVAVLLRRLERASEPFKIRVKELDLNGVCNRLGYWWSPNAPAVTFLQALPEEFRSPGDTTEEALGRTESEESLHGEEPATYSPPTTG